MTLYHTNAHGVNEQAVARTVARVVALASEAGINEAAVAVHTKDALVGNVLENVLGRPAIDKLRKGKVVIHGCTFYLLTERITPAGFLSGPVLAAYVTPAFLGKLHSDLRFTDVVYMPWMEQEMTDYVSANPDSIPV